MPPIAGLSDLAARLRAMVIAGVDLSRFGHAALELLLPTRCVGCGVRAAACCAGCAAVFGAPRPVACPGMPCDVGVYALAAYRGIARRLVLAYKERGRRDLAGTLGAELARAVPRLPGARADSDGTWWLVPVPSRPSAARVRGGQHVERLARHCAAGFGMRTPVSGSACALAPALRLRAGARDAVGLDRSQRAANLDGRLLLVPAGMPPKGTPVVLLDDVVTTGASLAASAGALHDGGVVVTAALALTAAGGFSVGPLD